MLIAAVVLVAAGLFLSAGEGVKGIWTSGDNQLTAANTAAGGNQTPTSGGGGGGNHRGGGNHHGGRRD